MLIMIACRQSNQKNEITETNEIPVTQVFVKDVTTVLEYVADIQAIKNVEIRARISGYLEEIYVDEGKPVKKGQILFKINDEEYVAALNSAKADLKAAEAEYKTAEVELERVKLLVEKNVIAKTEIDLAIAKLEIAKARIEQAKAHQIAAEVKLAHTNIKSPFDGIIDRIPFKLGSLISEGTLLTTISDIEAVNVYFNVSEIEYLDYFKNSKSDSIFKSQVELELADGSIFNAKGKIETMESEFEPGTGALAIRARFSNKDYLLKHGSTGKIKIIQKVKNAMLIPQKSVLEIQDKNYVFTVDKNNMVSMKSFRPLTRYGNYYLVSSGLEPKETIVYEGVQTLREGSIIKPVPVDNNMVYNIN